jgi:hypothetical protein
VTAPPDFVLGPQGKNTLRLNRMIRDWLGINARQGKVQAKPFGDGQDRLWMIGYVVWLVISVIYWDNEILS